MTKRETPAPAPVELTGPAAELVGIDPDDSAAIVRIVRPLSADERTALVVELVTAAPDRAPMVPTITGAPTGPDPVELIDRSIMDRIESMANVIGTASTTVDGFDPDPEAFADMVRAAVTRAMAEPDTDDAAVAAVESVTDPAPAPTGRRTRRSVARDWSSASGDYRTPGSPTLGTDPGTIQVRINQGTPTFTAVRTGTDHASATAALCEEDGWTEAGRSGGWGSPFEVLRRIGGRHDGETLGAITAV